MSNAAPTSRHVCSAMTTSPGRATACRRAARFGVSPLAVRSIADVPTPSSPTTTGPVAMPTRA